MSTEKINLDIHKILTLLPHRYPILLVDRVLELEPHKSIKALKNVIDQRAVFSGSLPDTSGDAGCADPRSARADGRAPDVRERTARPGERRSYYFVGIDRARFKRVVEPGDQLILNVTFERYMRGIWKFKARAEVDGTVAAEAELMCTVKNTGTEA